MTWGDFAKESAENSSSMVYGSSFAMGLLRHLSTRGICRRRNHPQNFVNLGYMNFGVAHFKGYEELWGMFVGQPFGESTPHSNCHQIATIGFDMAGFDWASFGTLGDPMDLRQALDLCSSLVWLYPLVSAPGPQIKLPAWSGCWSEGDPGYHLEDAISVESCWFTWWR